MKQSSSNLSKYATWWFKRKGGQNNMVDQSYNKDLKSYRNRELQTPVEGARARRGWCDTNASWADGYCLHSGRECSERNMASYKHREIAGMHLVYGMANCNGRTNALWMYRKKHPGRKVYSLSFFTTLHPRLCETCLLDVHKLDAGCQRITRTVDGEKRVVQKLQNNPSTSTRVASRETHIPQTTVWLIVHDEGTSLSLTTRPGLKLGDYKNVVYFAWWFL